MEKAKSGDRVRVHYVGRFTDGEVFDSSVARNEPLEFVLGSGMMIPGFDEAVHEMAPTEKKTVVIPAADAYGERSEENLITFDRAQVPSDMNPKIGDMLNLQDGQGQNIQVIVFDTTEEYIVLDANHPMAGHDLVFEIELVDIG
jgi:peptidylprolyl isomerase